MSNAPLIFPPTGGLPYRVASPGDIKVGDVYSIQSQPPRTATEPPVKGTRGWTIKSIHSLPVGFVAGERGMVRFWSIDVETSLLTDSGVSRLIDLSPSLSLLKGTFGFSTLEEAPHISISPTLRLATQAGVELMSKELGETFLETAVVVLRKRYRIPSIESYLALREGACAPTPTNLIRIQKSSHAASAALSKHRKLRSQV